MAYQIKFISVSYIILLGVGLFAHVEIIPAVLSTAGRDSWISMLMAFIPLVIMVPLIYKVGSILHNKSFIQLFHKDLGGIKFYLLFSPLILYLLLSAFISAKEIIYWSQLSFMQNFSSFIIALVLLLACFFCTRAGIETMVIISSVLLPIVVFLGFFVSFANMKKKNYELLFPIFKEDFSNILQGVIYTALPILEMALVLFFLPFLKKKITKKQLFFLGFILIGLMCGPTIGAIVEFGPDHAADFRYPAFEEWRIISIGRYISHTDFFAIFQWLSGGIIRISLFVYISAQLITKGKEKKLPIDIVFFIFLIACVFPLDQDYFYNFVYYFFLPISFFAISGQFFIVGIYVIKNRHKWTGG
ncbi:endospore germination permease [Cytobacillus purgationiresistens]|uniref:Spore germination protein (Amino acid permease) n=1 Tax=Cytobacillus purgationiresistens TaxID=863449 RepID=A0ABU0AAT0_9BACI|nr:endospore germination permease [Cytobacillus purgationiresistens]MDQ0268358.1 spore germination protein (amino acid permease) [Cytobacillus purgationiresistens]